MKKLSKLDVHEVSLVPRGANKKKFLVFKSDEEKPMSVASKLKQMILGVDDKKMAAVSRKIEQMSPISKSDGDMLPKADSRVYKDPAGDLAPKKDSATFKGKEGKDLSPQAQAALKAVARIAAPHKDEISGKHVADVLNEVGIPDKNQPGEVDGDMAELEKSMEEMEKNKAYPEKVKEEHKIEALSKAKKAWNEHMEKLGYRKYPDAEMAQKAKGKMEEDDDEDEESEDVDKAKMGKEKDKMEKTAVAKSDGLDLSAFPKEQRPQLEAIFKAHNELVKKNADLVSQIKEKEYVSKADGFKHIALPQADIVASLKAAENISPEELVRVEKMFTVLDEQAKSSKLFGTVGSSRSSTGSGDAEAKLNAAIDSVVQKSGNEKSRAQIADEFYRTEEGKRLYAEFNEEHQRKARGI